MKRDCMWYKEKLIDIAFNEKTMDKDTKAHLMTCSKCGRYCEQLSGIRENLNKFDLNIDINPLQINAAFIEADDIKTQTWPLKDSIKTGGRVSLKEVLLFILLALMMLAIPIVILAHFNIMYLLYVHIAIFLNMPLVLLTLLKVRGYDI